ncbi:MAG: glycosyltransferase family 2 protein [Elusimicrobia bacterium]|nr:glycosyltransferase family 2 protein [Elusimicrobiota bacterium]
MNQKKLTVTLIVPTMNEIDGIQWFMSRLKNEWYDELIIIDGGSTDGTLEYCRKNGYPIFVQSAKGLTMAQVEAFNRSTKDIIITLSPDGNSIPELIPVIAEKMREGYDMTIASRYIGPAKSYDDDRFTKIGNKIFTMMMNLLFASNYSDVLVIYRAYTRDAVMRMSLDKLEDENWIRKKYILLNSWEIASAARAALLKLKCAEIPGDEPKRIGGNRKLSIIVHGTAALLQVIYEFLLARFYLKK